MTYAWWADEKLSIAVASNWYEKCIDNFVVISGGLLAIARAHPDLIEGELPMHLLAPTADKAQTAGRRRPATASSAVGRGLAAAADQNTNANTLQGAASKRPTAGMSSASCASRSIPRPVQWNSLRESSSGYVFSGAGYSRSFDSGAGSLR